MSIKPISWNQSLNTSCNVFPIPKIFHAFNALCSTSLVTILANTQFPIVLSIFLTLKTLFKNIKSIFDLNDKLLNREPLKTVSFNI